MTHDMTESKIPQHVAIIMDGNGRWAQQRGMERPEGHIAGVESVRRVVKAAVNRGVRYLTLYTFSTENWGRPIEEVEAIMELFCRSVIGTDNKQGQIDLSSERGGKVCPVYRCKAGNKRRKLSTLQQMGEGGVYAELHLFGVHHDEA